jgi:hypothetical protein
MKNSPQPRDRRARQRRLLRWESLESRTLLSTSTETFTGPSLSALIQQAESGQDTAPAAINLVEQALEAQLTSGPLTDLESGAVDGDGFVTEVQGMESSYEQDLDQQLANFPNVAEILKLQGQQIVADAVSLNQQNAVGLISNAQLVTEAQAAIASPTNGPINALNTSVSGGAAATETFESNLTALAQTLSSTASPSLTPAQVSATALAETQAYQADLHAGLQVLHPNISNDVDSAVSTLETAESGLTQATDAATAQSQLTAAIAAFDATSLGTTGLFGSDGVISQAIASGQSFSPNLTIPQAASVMSSVSGTATQGGPATLYATVYSPSTGQDIGGVTVSFTLDGVFAGIAVTNSSGVATLSDVPTSDAIGTDTDGVVASFTGNIANVPCSATGDLTVNSPQAATTLYPVSGTDYYGGTATLSATLISTSSGQAVPNETISFTLDGASVGTAVTNSSGVATLTGVTTSDAVGTDTNGVVASFAGDSNNAASTGTGNLVVGPAATTLASVSGTASYGGTATLTATLTSSVTGVGISGETVSFTLDGTAETTTAVTDSSGVATLTGVTTSDAIGTDTDGVVASFAGDSNNAASTGTGNLVVGPAATTLVSVSGTASNGVATLTASLTSSATGAPIVGELVSFTLDGTPVGSIQTDSSGVATLTPVSTNDAVGTDTNGVVASFAGDPDDAASNGTGNLIVTS